MRLVEVLTGDAQSAIHWLEELGVEFTRDNGGYRLAKCGGATQKRLLQVGDRTGHAITKGLRDAVEALEHHRARERAARTSSSRAGARASASTRSTRARSSSPPAGRCYKEAEERGELSTNHPNATGEVTQIALGLGAEARDLDALQYHPNGGAWPANMQGYSIPETTRAYGAVLVNSARRGVHRLARPARRGLAGDLRRGREGERRRDARRPAGGAARHDAHPGGRRRRLAAVHAAALPGRRDRPPDPADLHLPCPPLPERRPRDRHRGRDDARGPLRLRRDRRRDARAQPDDGQLPARVLRVRTPRREGSGGKEHE